MQNNEHIDKLISDALGNAPPAPEQLRHNVMAAIRKRVSPKKPTLRHVYALASAAVMLIAVLGIYIVKDNLPGAKSNETAASDNAQLSTFSGAVIDAPQNESADGGAGDAEMFDDAEIAEDTEFMSVDLIPAFTPEGARQYDEEHKEIYENALIIRGDLPPELVGLVFTELEEGVYEFAGVSAEAAQKLVQAGAEGELFVSDEGLVRVLWVPEHINMDE